MLSAHRIRSTSDVLFKDEKITDIEQNIILVYTRTSSELTYILRIQKSLILAISS